MERDIPEIVIRVKYSCTLCGLIDATVDVPPRKRDEDVIAWMDRVGFSMSQDHATRSPHCHPKELHNVMIPVTGVNRIGDPPTM